MRGYRVLKKSGRIGQITCVKQALTERSLGIQKKDFSFLVMGAGVVFSELIVRQYLLVLFGGLGGNILQTLAAERFEVFHVLRVLGAVIGDLRLDLHVDGRLVAAVRLFGGGRSRILLRQFLG